VGHARVEIDMWNFAGGNVVGTIVQEVIIIIIIFLHGLGRLTCSGIDALPSFPRASTISSSSRFVVEDVFQKSGGLVEGVIGIILERNLIPQIKGCGLDSLIHNMIHWGAVGNTMAYLWFP
jgi:hypothetical protein